MRPLTDEEIKVFFTKLAVYIGENIKFLIERSDESYVFRLIKNKVYCPVHWILPEEIDKKEFKDSLNISERILTIPIDQKYAKAFAYGPKE